MALAGISLVVVMCGSWQKRGEAGRVRSAGRPSPMCQDDAVYLHVCVCVHVLGMSVCAHVRRAVSCFMQCLAP